jgi:polysaccharide deacetylase family protein (PEP-CTERM system associated)
VVNDASVYNALSVDVEDWYHVCGLPVEPIVAKREWRVEQNVERLLFLLAEHRVRATFFVLGCVAEALPALVPRISAAGHEIASHGYSHRLVGGLTPEAFRDEIRRTDEILRRQSGQKPVGFRAPQWSLAMTRTPWAFETLLDEGYRYDSSLNPLPFVGDRHGRRTPHRLPVGSGYLWEVPPLVASSPLGNLPAGGGWGFRVLPCGVICRSVDRANREGAPAVFYLHPRELDADGPRLKLSPLRSFAAYGPHRDVVPRLERLLKRYRFTTLQDLIATWESA